MKKIVKVIVGALVGLSMIVPQTVKANSNRVYLHEPHRGASSETFSKEDDDGGLENLVVWHFIFNQVEEIQSETLQIFVEFEKTGLVGPIGGNPVGNKEKTWHFFVGTDTHDVIKTAYIDVVGESGNFVLSHVSLNEPPVVDPKDPGDEDDNDEDDNDEDDNDEDDNDEDDEDDEVDEEEPDDSDDDEDQTDPIEEEEEEPINEEEEDPIDEEVPVDEEEPTDEEEPIKEEPKEEPVYVEPTDKSLPKTGSVDSSTLTLFGGLISSLGILFLLPKRKK